MSENKGIGRKKISADLMCYMQLWAEIELGVGKSPLDLLD